MTTKALILLRGLPGSGKSTLAQLLSENGTYPVWEIDAYFTDSHTGAYTYRYEENYKAHALCLTNTRNSLQQGHQKVFVANTFSTERELSPYLELAQEFKYQLHVMVVENYHGSNTIHGISREQIARMAAKFKVQLTP